MQISRFDLPTVLLIFVATSSLVLLFFGLDPAPSFISFQHYPTVIAQVLFITAVFARAERREALLGMTSAQKLCLFVLFLYVPFTSYISPIPTAIFLSQFWTIHVLFFVALLAFFRSNTGPTEDTVWKATGIAALLHVLAFFFAWAVWPEQIWAGILPVFENIRFLGYFLSPVAAVMAVWFLTRLGYQVLPLCCYAAAAFYLIYTGSRGGAIACVGALVIAGAYIALTRQNMAVRKLFILIGVTGLLIFLSTLLPKLPWAPLFDRAANVPDQTTTQALSSRDLLWSDVANAIRERWLFGYGPSFVTHVFNYALDPGDIQFVRENIRNPHNSILQLLLHWGVIGTFIILATAGSFTRNIWSSLLGRPDRALLPFVAITTMMIHSLVSGVFFYPYSTVVGIIAFASMAAKSR